MPIPIHSMRYIAGQPVQQIAPPQAFHSVDAELFAGAPLPVPGNIQLLVWNIFKQQRAQWLTVLERFASQAHLVLLQEAQSTPELVSFATRYYQAADQVPALRFAPHPCGVMTLAAAQPLYCCPLCEREPIFRLAKSALVTVYPLPGGQLLMVINIHAVNFTLGTESYSKQLGTIGEQIRYHQGPVIMAGDFNAWSRSRIYALSRFARKMALREVCFADDHRRRAFGHPLDFVFYRHLAVHSASVLVTQASDHNPLLVEFSLL